MELGVDGNLRILHNSMVSTVTIKWEDIIRAIIFIIFVGLLVYLQDLQ
jgi:hypothetical protein